MLKEFQVKGRPHKQFVSRKTMSLKSTGIEHMHTQLFLRAAGALNFARVKMHAVV